MQDTETPAPPETVEKFLVGYGEFKDLAGSIRATIMGELVKLSAPFVKHYHSDYYHDAIWLQQTIKEECLFYFSFDECGTWLSFDPVLGLARRFGYTMRLTCEDNGKWMLRAQQVM